MWKSQLLELQVIEISAREAFYLLMRGILRSISTISNHIYDIHFDTDAIAGIFATRVDTITIASVTVGSGLSRVENYATFF